MNRNLNYNIHDKLTLQVIWKKKSFFDYRMLSLLKRYQISEELKNPDVSITIAPFKPKNENCYIVGRRYWVKENYVYYKSFYKGGMWEAEIIGIEDDHSEVNVNWNQLGSLMGPGIIFLDLIKIKFTLKGFNFLHGSAVNRDQKGYLMLARSGVGKTIILAKLAKDNFKILGDDKNILGPNNQLYGFALPINIKFTYDVKRIINLNLFRRLELKFKKFLYFCTGGSLSILTPIETEKLFGGMICAKTCLNHVIEMIQGPDLRISENADYAKAVQRAFYNSTFESDELNQLVASYASIFPEKRLSCFWDIFKENLEKNMRNIKLYRVILPKTFKDEYYKKMKEAIFK